MRFPDTVVGDRSRGIDTIIRDTIRFASRVTDGAAKSVITQLTANRGISRNEW